MCIQIWCDSKHKLLSMSGNSEVFESIRRKVLQQWQGITITITGNFTWSRLGTTNAPTTNVRKTYFNI